MEKEVEKLSTTKVKRTFADYLRKPIEVNPLFFVFMLLVGIIMNVSHRNLFGYLELLADVYVVSFLLSLFPKVLRRGLQIMLCSITYSIAFVDACCKTLFGTPITPTMLLLAQETTGRETEEFFSQYIKPELLFSTAGLILLIALLHIVMAVRKQTFRSSFFKQPIIASTLGITLLVGIVLSVYDKTQLYTARNLSELEIAVVNGFAHIYHPVERVAYDFILII